MLITSSKYNIKPCKTHKKHNQNRIIYRNFIENKPFIYRKLNQHQASRSGGASLSEEACASLDEAFASSDEACASLMRHTPHQPVLRLLVYLKHKILNFQAI